MRIQNMFVDDINRKINGVIKVDQDADDVLEQELNEYVITKELKKHFITFFNYYSDAFSEPTADMEEADGTEELLNQLQSAIGQEEFIEKMQYSPHNQGDVLLITGVGDVFPFMRVHSLLEALQPHFSDIPILVMYPGRFDRHYLKLFDKLQPNDYYRAFNIV